MRRQSPSGRRGRGSRRSAAQATGNPPAPISSRLPAARSLLSRFTKRKCAAIRDDQITLRMLGGEYLAAIPRDRRSQRRHPCARGRAGSLRLQPQGNVRPLGVIASGETRPPQLRSGARRRTRGGGGRRPSTTALRAQTASILMEIGRYGEAAPDPCAPAQQPDPNPTWMSIRARYDELTGNLPGARIQMDASDRGSIDRMIDHPGLHALLVSRARRTTSLRSRRRRRRPTLSSRRRCASSPIMPWRCSSKRSFTARTAIGRALASATRSAELYPLPQALGYQADAQRALGDAAGARKTDALHPRRAALFNVQGVNDRLLAMYYAEHREHLRDALAAARSDLAKRGDEIYADDTMAWVLAAMGRWQQARVLRACARRATVRSDPELAISRRRSSRCIPGMPTEARSATRAPRSRPIRTFTRSMPTMRARRSRRWGIKCTPFARRSLRSTPF